MKKIFFILLVLITNCWEASTQTGSDIIIGATFEIESEILQQERSYQVYLPSSYEGDEFYIEKQYPVLVLLDGQRLFHLVSGMVQSMSSGGTEQIPEMIIIGVSSYNRSQDFLPSNESSADGSILFKEFLEKELLPEIDMRYRTNHCRILVGHSYGGLFVVNTFLNESDFNVYLAMDPSLWWDDELVIKKANEELTSRKNIPSSLYIGQANNPFNEGIEAGRMGKAIQGFRRILEEQSLSSIKYQVDFFEKEDHFSIPLISLYEGLLFLFDGYKYPLNKMEKESPQAIQDHYLKLSKRFGGDLLPPGKLLNQVGQFLVQQENTQEAGLGLLQLNQHYYGNSYIPHHSLGVGYQLKGDRHLAIKHFKKSLALNPLNEDARDRIKQLEDSKMDHK